MNNKLQQENREGDHEVLSALSLDHMSVTIIVLWSWAGVFIYFWSNVRVIHVNERSEPFSKYSTALFFIFFLANL
jgi:hypothetical protein